MVASTVGSAIAAFVATNLDDLVILMLLFAAVSKPGSPANLARREMRRQDIYSGQYLGFIALVLASLPGFIGGQILPRSWIGWLGLVPIALGLKALWDNRGDSSEAESIQAQSIQALPPKALAAMLQRFGARVWFNPRWLTPQTLGIAALTVANGADNISIYLALFASCTSLQLSLTLAVFLPMVWVWCRGAEYLVTHRALGSLLNRYGSALMPWVLIALGGSIIWEHLWQGT
jgi:cadmium resistance protein CadD (predicted permease)